MKTPVSEELINKSSGLILRYSLSSLAEVGMAEAFSKGHYPDLKDLVCVNNVDDVDLELMEALDDPKLNAVLSSIYLIVEHIEKQIIIKNLDELECRNDPEVCEFANTFFNTFRWPVKQDFDFWETAWVYLSVIRRTATTVISSMAIKRLVN